MKVHPAPRKSNITLRYDVTSLLAQANGCRQKKLRWLAHIFAKILELRFTAATSAGYRSFAHRQLVSAAYEDGDLVVTVLEGADEDDDDWDLGNRGRLVLVQ
ncbi:hypothetical protein SASPL_122507 [Salvia splendens]|uniref:Uncharacterized protein n=1 Tax=Salvia splendens TaxID=180675 RepID=A0A8X8XJP4_SALSN|nr:hypothetical protein SASPL_122507 [Salvia splendens]